MIQFVEQVLNGVQFGVMLFLMAAGLTLIFGIMNVINLAHGSLYMVGAYVAAAVFAATGSFFVGLAPAPPPAGFLGLSLGGLVFPPPFPPGPLHPVFAPLRPSPLFLQHVRLFFR